MEKDISTKRFNIVLQMIVNLQKFASLLTKPRMALTNFKD